MTKRFLTIAPLLLFIGVATRAQVYMGIEGGPDLCRILNILEETNSYGQSYKNSQSVTHWNGGVFFDIPLDKNGRFILRPTLRYLGAGGQTPQVIDFAGNMLAAKTTYLFNYLQLPVQLLYSPAFSFGAPWIGGGFYPGVVLSAKAKSNNGSYSMTIGNASYNDIRLFDFGFNATAGLTLKCGVLIGVDFQQGLVGINPTNASSGSTAPKVRNSVWAARIGYRWSLAAKPHS